VTNLHQLLIFQKFFETYLTEFGALSKERASAAYRNLKKTDPTPEQLRRFRKGIADEMRIQLLWLTRNSIPRMTALFKKYTGIAAKILLNFTVNLPDAKKIENTYAAPAEKPVNNRVKWVTCAGLNGKKHTYYITPPPQHDGHFGFLLSDGTRISRKSVVEKLLPFVRKETPAIVRFLNGKKFELPLRVYLAEEVGEFLCNKEIRHTVAEKFQSEKELSKGLELADELPEIMQKMKILYKKFLQYVPKDRRNGLIDLIALRNYYLKKRTPLLQNQFMQVSMNQQNFRTTAIRHMSAAIKKMEKFQHFCAKPEVVEAYLKFGIGFNQPLGARTAAMAAAAFNYQVEVYKKDIKDGLVLQEQHKCNAAPVMRIKLGKRLNRWTLLTDQMPVQPASNVFMRKPNLDIDLDDENLSFDSHPFVTVAQELFWSVSDKPKQQENIREEMNSGYPTRPSLGGDKNATDYLFLFDQPKNIAAIKRGVLRADSLQALSPMLIGLSNSIKQVIVEPSLDRVAPYTKHILNSRREQAYYLIALLLADPIDGILYQRIFQNLIRSHHDDLFTDDQIKAFYNWLDNVATKLFNDIDMVEKVRACYTVAMLLEVQSKGDEKHVNKKADKILSLLNKAYPKDDFLTAFHCIHPVFEKQAKWSESYHIFNLFFVRKLFLVDKIQIMNQTGFNFLSCDGKKDLIPTIVKGFEGDIFNEAKAKSDIAVWAYIVKNIIGEAATIRREFMEGVVKRLCSEIKNPESDLDLETRINLGLALLSALHDRARKEGSANALLTAGQMCLALQAITDAGIKINQFSFTKQNKRLELLNAMSGLNKVNTNKKSLKNICLETFYVRIAGYLLSDVNKQTQLNAENLLLSVVVNPKAYKNIMPQERTYLGKYMGSLIDSACSVVRHRSIFLFFYDIRGFNNISLYGSALVKWCEKLSINKSNSFSGLKNLIDYIETNEFFTSNFKEEEIQVVIERIVSLALYQTYKDMPRPYQLFGNQKMLQNQRNELSTTLSNMLSILGEYKDDKAISEAFADEAALALAFKEMGIDDSRKAICEAIKNYRKKPWKSFSPSKSDDIQMLDLDDPEIDFSNNNMNLI